MATGLLFSGQGAQAVGMGRSLYENNASARELFERADAVLGYALSKLCFEGPQEALTPTKVCQPALYVHGYAAFTVLRERGKLEGLKTALGLSLGELTALAAAEAFDFETGLRTVAERGRLMQEACEATEGTMASVIGGEREKVQELCEACDIDMANLNCSGQIVISGEKAKVLDAVERAKGMGFKLVKPLVVAGAYHSRLMEPARKAFEGFLQTVDIQAPKLKVFTNTTGGLVESPEAIREALTKQVVSSVLWEDCMRGAAALGVETFYECGPGAVLAGLAKRIDREIKVVSVAEDTDVPA